MRRKKIIIIRRRLGRLVHPYPPATEPEPETALLRCTGCGVTFEVKRKELRYYRRRILCQSCRKKRNRELRSR